MYTGVFCVACDIFQVACDIFEIEHCSISFPVACEFGNIFKPGVHAMICYLTPENTPYTVYDSVIYNNLTSRTMYTGVFRVANDIFQVACNIFEIEHCSISFHVAYDFGIFKQ